jgi:superfamily II DNA/RNA helicase
LSNPRKVSVAPPASTASTVSQMLMWVREDDKMQTLDKLIRQEDVKNAFIFCNRKKDIAGLTRFLQRKGYSAGCLHGDMVQAKRYETLDAFKADKISLMVCSDVAARGIDIKGVSHVFNYDVPMSADDYVHRIGRTGRAGLTGRAWMLATQRESKYVESIEKLIGKKIPVEKLGGGSGDASAGEERAEEPRRNDRDRSRNNDRGGRGGSNSRHQNRPDNRPDSRQAQKSGPRDQGQQQHSRPRDDNRRPLPRRHEQDDGPDSFGDDIPSFLR